MRVGSSGGAATPVVAGGTRSLRLPFRHRRRRRRAFPPLFLACTCLLVLKGNIQIFFKSPQVSGDKTMTLDVSRHDTVEDIKVKIQEKEGTPVHIQRLIFDCHHLKNHLTVAQCNIQRGSTIHSFLSWSVPELSL